MEITKDSKQRGRKKDRYCDRCARRSSTLIFDEISLRELCPLCWRELDGRRTNLHARTRKMA